MESAQALLEAFHAVYPQAASPRLCRAPGRINLIGEHIDYNGLPVLPMAIHREIRIAFAPRSDARVRVRSRNPSYPPAEFENARAVPPSLPGAWENYCKAAVQGLNDYLKPPALPGMDLLVSGDIPVAAGLSSSSALVVACSLAYLAVLNRELDRDLSRLTLAVLLAHAEQYVGTRGGGMDQAIILLARRDHACKIDFHPLRIEPLPLPKGVAIVACHSLVKANKTGEALHRYNEGPLTSRLIRVLAEKQVREEFDDEIRLGRLADLWFGNLCLTHAEVEDLFDRVFPTETTSLEKAAYMLALSAEEVRTRWIGDLQEPARGFRLRARARHQRTEFQRVEKARDALIAGDMECLGRLMNESHDSCALDYSVSCPELDQLVRHARAAGALGARLTGAGFGGCTVNLVEATRRDSFQHRILRTYYQDTVGLRTAQIPPDCIMEIESASGAGYLE